MANRQGNRNYLYAGLGGLLLLAFLVVAAYSIAPPEGCVGVVEIQGPIVSDDVPATLFSDEVNGAETIAGQIKSAEGRAEVKSVLVLIDSPGGSVVATREIYDALAGLNKSKVAYIHEMGTSGGYYVASAADYVMAHPDAITGNIGARITLADMSGLFSKLGYNETSIKSGAMKDMGTPARPLTQDEEAVLASIVNESFSEFREAVEKGRGSRLDAALWQQALDARLLTGRQAKKIGLVDEVGGRQMALKKAAALGGMAGEGPQECVLSKSRGKKSLLGSFASEALQTLLQKAAWPSLSYN
jgi:protease-4